MAKLAQKKPEAIKTVVSIAQNHAEVWYARPLALGRIDYQNGYWYTLDKMRFVSSRDAMEYLIRMHDLKERGETPAPVRAAATAVNIEKPVSKKKTVPTVAVPPLPPSREALFDSFLSWMKEKQQG